MAWNNGLERMKFEAEQAKLAAEYRAAGMTEEQIQQMYEFDLEVFNGNRRFAEHTQQFPESPFEDGDEGQSPLYEKFPEALTVTMCLPVGSDRFSWIDEIDDEQLVERLNRLSAEELDLITRIAMDEQTQSEVAAELGVNQSTISRRLEKIIKILKKCA